MYGQAEPYLDPQALAPGSFEQLEEVTASGVSDLVERNGFKPSNFLSYVLHQAWLVDLAAKRDRRQVGGIGLDQHAVQGNLPGDFLQGEGVLEGDDPGEGDPEVEIHGCLRLFPGPGKAVHDAPNLPRALLPQDSQGIGSGIPHMDDERLAATAR